jgi:hypothetical protein
VVEEPPAAQRPGSVVGAAEPHDRVARPAPVGKGVWNRAGVAPVLEGWGLWAKYCSGACRTATHPRTTGHRRPRSCSGGCARTSGAAGEFSLHGWGASAAGRRLRLHLVDESRC